MLERYSSTSQAHQLPWRGPGGQDQAEAERSHEQANLTRCDDSLNANIVTKTCALALGLNAHCSSVLFKGVCEYRIIKWT